MKKFLALIALMLLPAVGCLAQYDDLGAYAATQVGVALLIVAVIIYLVVLGLCIAMFVKQWMMCNDVRKIRRYIEYKLQNPDNK